MPTTMVAPDPSSPAAPTAHSFDPAKLPSVSVQRSDGSTTSHTVRLTPKAKPEKLLPALESLLNDSWILDERGDAIHRHLAFKDDSDATEFQSLLKAAADEMNHHPHVTTGDATTVTVTCTTHNPRGLSMRDARLATKVEELASNFDLVSATSTPASTLRQRDQRLVNRAAIDKVLSEGSGACFAAEKKPGK